MTITMRERLHRFLPNHAVPGASHPIHITAAVEDRRDLVVIVNGDRWSVFDPGTANSEWLGDIAREDDHYTAIHEEGPTGYRFRDFGAGLTYFMEYGFALRFGRGIGCSE